MLSPAQPSPSPSGKKMHHFWILFSAKILKDREIMLFQNRKNKIPVVNENQCFLMIFRRKLNVKKSTRRSCNGYQGAICALVTWWFFHVFRVLPDPLQDRRVDFLTLNLDEKSCYFRVFFACFLTHCETEVLIFWRSISTKNRVIFVCFSRAFWPIARPACWFFRVTRSVGF